MQIIYSFLFLKMRYDKEKRFFLAKKLIKLGNPTLVQRSWRTEFKNIKAPSRSTILDIVSKLEKTGTLNDMPPLQNKPVDRFENVKNQLKTLYKENPSLSLRKAACVLGISYNATRDVLKNHLHLKPYKYNDYHELEPEDYPKRVKFASWFLSLPKNSHEWFVFSDEAYFYLTQSINKQNNRMWLESRPIDWIERPLHDKKVLVWCAISAAKIYGPYFFEETVNQHNYLDMLRIFFWPKHLRTESYKNYYFQQDGATPHTADLVQEWLSSKLLDKFIDKTQWPPRSPDLNPCDYFLWGYLKSKVYNPLPKNLNDLKSNIEREIKKINREMLKSTMLNFEKRCTLLITVKGEHIENQ